MGTTKMSRRIQIASLRPSRISAEIRDALLDGVDSARLADFLADIDWGSIEQASAPVKARLGLLEQWSTQFAEGDISAADYRRHLETLILVRTERAVCSA